MHDPKVVAFDIPNPLPRRERYREKNYRGRRWGFTRARFTNPEHLGKPIYRWLRPKGWTLALGGRVYGMRTLATIWHNEPGGHDAFHVCKHASRWQWHVHHWSIQIQPLQGLRARLFDRCAECGRKGRPNHSFQWDGDRLGWWKLRSRKGLYHRECADLRSLRSAVKEHELIHRTTVGALCIAWDMSTEEVLRRLFPGSGGYSGQYDGPGDFNLRYRLEKLMERTANEPARVGR